METSSPHRRLVGWFIGTAFFTFVVLLHVTFPNLGGTGLRMPHNAAMWMGFAVLMALAIWPASKGVIRFSAFHKGLGLLLVALWLPLAWSWNEASHLALPRLLTLTAGALLLLGVAQLPLTRRHWWWLGMAILAGALLETAYGYVQVYLLEPGNWVGYNPDYGRPWGVFQQVNVMASFLAVGLVISAWLYGEARSRLEKGVILLAPLFMPAMLWVIASRSGWLGAAIGVPLVLVHLWGLERARFRQWAGALLGGLVLAVVVANTGGGTARSAEAITSQGLRPQVYEHSLRMIAEKPIAGWGYGRFVHDFVHSHADWRTAEEGRAPLREHYGHPHNELFYWGIEGGLLPVLAILAFALWLARRIITRGPRSERLMLLALLAPLAVHSLLELPFYHSIAHWLVMLLLLGLVASRCWETKERGNRYTFGVKLVGGLAAPALVLFMATHLHTLWQVKAHVESGGERPGTLTAIINPFGMPMTLDFQLMSQQLKAAAGLGIGGFVEEYLVWGEKHAQLAPNPALYANMVRAERMLGRDPEGSEIGQQAGRLFPTFEVVTEALKPNASAAEIITATDEVE